MNISKLNELSEDRTYGMTVDLASNSVEFEDFEKFLYFYKDDELLSPATGQKYTSIIKKRR